VLLVGGPGTAKTNIANQFLGRFNLDQAISKTITFSSLTTPGIFQVTLEASYSCHPLLTCNQTQPSSHKFSPDSLNILQKKPKKKKIRDIFSFLLPQLRASLH
jgi:hypothetical protein